MTIVPVKKLDRYFDNYNEKLTHHCFVTGFYRKPPPCQTRNRSVDRMT